MSNITRRMLQCSTPVNKGAIKRTVVNGVEHIIVSSYTLPDNIVMNGCLYPASEIESSYDTLERTLAPVEHPTDADGNFISASDPEAIHNFHAGAFNVNVTRSNGRVHIEKHINVQEALKTARGKRLLDRICELETNDKPRPIHTSVAAFLELEKLDKIQTNADGIEYSFVARNMVFDHDAILLDSVGAAQPHQGVGIAVNSAGDKVDVEHVVLDVYSVKAATNLPLADSSRPWDSSAALKRVKSSIGADDAPNATYARYHLWYDAENQENFGAYKLPFVDIVDGKAHAIPAALRNAAARLSQTKGPSEADKTRIKSIIDTYLSKLKTNAEGVSFVSVMETLQQQINGIVTADWIHLVDVFATEVIFETPQGYSSVPWKMSEGQAVMAGIPVRVEKTVTYEPKTNSEREEGAQTMYKTYIMNALAANGIKTDGLSDENLLAEFDKLQAKDGDLIAQTITNAVKPLQDQIAEMKAQLTANINAEVDKLVSVIVNSKKYPGIDETAAKALPIDALKAMAANCSAAHGVPLVVNDGVVADEFAAPADMPN